MLCTTYTFMQMRTELSLLPSLSKIYNNRMVKIPVYAQIRYNNGFVLLHHFVKKTQKTPKREIEQAKRELADWIERGGTDEG